MTRALSIALTALVLLSPLPAGATEEHRTTVGMEGSVVVTLPGPEVVAVPVTDSSDLVLRIGRVEKTDDAFTYHLHYLGTKPGQHNLADYLVYKNKLPLTNAVPIPVVIENKLPARHGGALTAIDPAPLSDSAWYWFTMPAVILLWLLLLILLIFYKRRKPLPGPFPQHIPTLVERLEPLVAKASEGKLSIEEKAHLEGLMLLFWCDELDLDREDIGPSLRTLKQHEVAGELIRAIEGWLHKPPGREHIPMDQLLDPYKHATRAAG